MGAGILPVTVFKGSILFLLGREQHHNNYWCDFGGKSNLNESVFETAIREGYEEIDGLFGNKKKLSKSVSDNLISVYNIDRYTTHLFYVNPDILTNFPYYFNNHREFLEDENLIINNKKEGLFEKNKVKLFSKNDLILNYDNIRPFYKEVVNDLLKIEKKSMNKFIH
tara:strand:- start:11 stop:511 length:501 start_codon:yes stop_codon:yes gene_type:complete